ncbi:MAG: anaerobic ribonucleoside-triphosphate reductase activating protein [Alphaproteobacteria bacterium]|nr:anaerobic ribonucleoside-triphosphate reductase activating protein [Alphaproteobacteria bacterium]
MREIQIGGLVPFTTIDYPGKLAAVLFLVGCPLRCAYCSNPHLLQVGDGPYDPEKTFDWIKSRTGRLEAIVFSGGEALMQGDATIEYMKRVRELGFAIGLHTNGFYPDLLKRAAPFVDWAGIDYKATRAKYESLVGNGIAYDQMSKSLDFWISTGKDFEVRVTCDPRFITKDDLMEIVQDCAGRGVKKIAIQKYQPHFEDAEHATTPEAREQFFNNTELRNYINSKFESVVWRE